MNTSLPEDWFLLPYELALQSAHAQTLEKAGILTVTERQQVDGALGQIRTEYGWSSCPESDAEDLHTWMEGELIRRVGEAGRKIHTARSRNDQVATLLVLFLIDAGKQLSTQLAAMIALGCRRAVDWSDYAFPLQTHTQFAAPGTVGFWMLRYAVSWDRLRGHAKYYTGRWQETCPLGSGAVAGSSIPIDRGEQARLLGFAGPSPNALASTSTRDECVEFLALASQVALHLQSFAADIIAFSQTPLNWTRYPRAFGTGSSMMPNKINPDAMELLRGESCAIIAAWTEAVSLLKGLPSGYHRDLQCIKPIVHRAADRLDVLLAMTTAFLGQLEFDPERLRAALAMGHVDATLRMEQLVKQGTPLREAHGTVAAEVLASPTAEAGGAADLAAYQTTGGGNPTETRRVAEAILASLETS